MMAAWIKPRARLTNGKWEVRSSLPVNPCKGYSESLPGAFERYMAATWHWYNSIGYRRQAEQAMLAEMQRERIGKTAREQMGNGGW